ncbi:MAG: hypothetical protein HFH68_12505 [Lachnospiraceae bacterium]|nr:hypothetical protein [Lachnospiraceae bacterium]
MTQLYITKILDNNTYNYEKFLQYIPDEKRNKIIKYKFKKDMLMSLIGEALLRYGLKRQYGIIE